MKKLYFLLLLAFLLIGAARAFGAPVRIKELVEVQGVRGNVLYGYGLVVGLAGTGDTEQVFFTSQSISGMLGRLGIRIDPRDGRLLGTIDLSDMNVESAETVAARIRRALPFVPAENILVATDCGMKYLPREVANGKMRAMVEGAQIVRKELGDT